MGTVTELLEGISNELGITISSKSVSDNIEHYLKVFCQSVSPVQFFSTKTFSNASTIDLLHTIGILLDYDFVIEWFFGVDCVSVGTELTKQTKYSNKELNLVAVVYSKARVPELSNEFSISEIDCGRIIENAKLGLRILKKLLQFISFNECSSKAKYNVAVYSVLLCLEHVKKTKWSNEYLNSLCHELLELAFLEDNGSLKDFLVKPSKWNQDMHCYDDIFKTLQPKLSSSNWKKNPALPNVFLKLVKSLKFPQLSECLTYILPPTLLFLDDSEEENACLGHDCLNCILNNTTKSELRQFGMSDVIFDCLLKQLYTKNELILEKLLENLCLVLKSIETAPSALYDVGKEKKCDRAFGIILTQMGLENQLILRKVYCQFLTKFLQLLGLTSLKHMKLILKVITSYLETADGRDGDCREKTLEALLLMIGSCWPRIHSHAFDITKSLIRLLHELSGSSCDIDEAVCDIDEAVCDRQLQLITSCLKTLNEIVPDVKTYIDPILILNLGGKFDSTLQNIFI